MRRLLAVLVRNQPGVLTRVASLFSRRGFNIESVAVGQTEDPDTSRMTLVVDEDETGIEQVVKQLHKLIDVLKVSDLTDDDLVERELLLVKVNAEAARRMEVLQIADIFRARVVDVSESSMVLEVTGDPGKVEAILRLLRGFGLKELARTGVVAMARGARATRTPLAEREGVRV